ncbi:MAG: trypsin-like peptidase domain-containing protein, partial [Chlorobiales bacterium]|nr:trypsin-like peptidase domain-containing protein [Chlorobiales bacterium]
AAPVVHVADIVTVRFKDGRKVGARVVGSAVRADVALLRLNEVPDGLTVADLGDSDAMDIGDQVFVVGAPYGIDHTLTVGHVSGRRSLKGFANQLVNIEFLQTDASINRGNSGGPMFNMDGEVVGIVSSISSSSGGSEGLGFAASINTARDLLLKQQSIWTGMEAYFLSGPISKALNVPQESALLVQRVAENSPSKLLGLVPGSIPVRIGREEFLLGGDIILEVQGIPVAADYRTMKALQEAMLFTTSGRSVTIKVLRGGKIINLSRSATRPRDEP